MAKHERPGKSDEWYTPPHVFEALGCEFNMDVASPGAHAVPWVPAPRHLVSHSLEQDWHGFVWMNPPFGGRNGLMPWLKKFVAHGNGIALTPDRTSAPWWQIYAPRMDVVLFVSPKIHFVPGPGAKASSPAQGTCLMGIGERAVEALNRAASNGLGVLLLPDGYTRPDDPIRMPVCANADGDDQCDGCICWKQTRAMCS